MISLECSGQRAVVGLLYHAVTHPLPELRLGGPKLFTVAANNQRGLFLFRFLLFVFACTYVLLFESIHFCPVIFRAFESTLESRGTPKGNLSSEAAFSFQTTSDAGIACVYINRREISSARRRTPNLTKIFRK